MADLWFHPCLTESEFLQLGRGNRDSEKAQVCSDPWLSLKTTALHEPLRRAYHSGWWQGSWLSQSLIELTAPGLPRPARTEPGASTDTAP